MSYTALMVGGPKQGQLVAIPGGMHEVILATTDDLLLSAPPMQTIPYNTRRYRREMVFTVDPDGTRYELTCMLYDELWKGEAERRTRLAMGAAMRFVPHVVKREPER